MKRCSKKIPQNSRQNSCERLFLVLVRIGLVWSAANLVMLCRIDCKSVFKVLSFSIEMQSSTDFALISTQSMYESWYVNKNDNGGRSSYPGSSEGKSWNIVSLTNFFGMLYPCLKWGVICKAKKSNNFLTLSNLSGIMFV